jgi:hypothetical protein
MKEWVKDKPEFIKRLENLCYLVLDPEAAGRRRKEKFAMGYRPHNTRSSRDGGIEEGPQELDLGPKMKLNLNFKVSTRDVERDTDGKPVMPFMAKGATIINLGTVVYDRQAFWNKNYIWPAGFKSSRKLPSIKNPNEYVTYTSEIVDGGSSGPVFTVTPADDPSRVFSHSTSSGVWCETLKLIKKKPNVSVSGPEVFFLLWYLITLFRCLGSATQQ